MIRPDVKALFWRGREVIAALGFAALGLWFAAVSFGVVQWIGWAMAGLGGALAFVALQRVRFMAAGDGPGVVTLDERRITYFGPLDGGVTDLDLMVQLDITASDDPRWRLIDREGRSLDIPVNAAGAEALFDVFAALPGMKTEHMLGLLNRPRRTPMTVWMAPDHKPYTQLH